VKVAIRLDASTAIGTGHLKRMLALAHALRKAGGDIRLVARRLDIDVAALASVEGVATITLPAPDGAFAPDPAIAHAAWAGVAQIQDAEQTAAALKAWQPDAVIVDHYAFDARWHRQVAEALGIVLMVVDDLADRPLAGDWLVDHNFHPDHDAKYAGRLAPGMRMLAGPRYAMLGSVYADAPRHVFAERVSSIGVFLGGVDARADTLRVLAALDAAGWTGPVEVVTTSANPGLARLEAAVAARPGTTLTRDLPDLAAFFARHDLQIGAGGGAIWERCCIGPPTLCLVCAENQRLSVPFLDAAGIVMGYDMLVDAPPQPLTLAQLIAAVIEDSPRRRAIRDAAMALVDGRGADRIASALVEGR